MFIACWITSQWKVKTLIYQCCHYFPLSAKVPVKLLFGISLQQVNKLFWQHPSPGAPSPAQPGVTSPRAEPLGTGQLPFFLIHLLRMAYEDLTVYKSSN